MPKIHSFIVDIKDVRIPEGALTEIAPEVNALSCSLPGGSGSEAASAARPGDVLVNNLLGMIEECFCFEGEADEGLFAAYVFPYSIDLLERTLAIVAPHVIHADGTTPRLVAVSERGQVCMYTFPRGVLHVSDVSYIPIERPRRVWWAN